MDPASNRFRHPAKLGVGTAFDLIIALQFKRNVIRPALLALDKAVEKVGMGRGEYTRKPAIQF